MREVVQALQRIRTKIRIKVAVAEIFWWKSKSGGLWGKRV